MRQFRAIVTDIRQEGRIAGITRWQLQLDKTEFRAGDAGRIQAIARSGALLEAAVLAVSEDAAGQLWHTIEKPLAAGTEITGWVER